jgi:plastocyanin
MRRIRSARAPVIAGALGLLAAVAGAAPAAAATQPVTIQFSAFGPSQVDALPGDTISWTNASTRVHTVVSDTGLFGSAQLATGGAFAWTSTQTGVYAYHCSIHPSMTGEIDVRGVTLGPVPTAALVAGTKVALDGRTADPTQPVRIERSTDGTRFTTIATATPDASGDWRASVSAARTADLRAASATGVSETRRVLVSDRKVRVRRTRRGVAVSVTPSDPGGRVMLQLRLRERFGWWTVSRKRLDFLSEASFRIARRPARARVVLVDRDGWSSLATSRVVTFGGHGGHGGHERPGRGGADHGGMHMGRAGS